MVKRLKRRKLLFFHLIFVYNTDKEGMMMKRWICLSLFWFFILLLPAYAEEIEYKLYDFESESEIEAVSDLETALLHFENIKESYGNLGLLRNEKIIKVEYGVISIYSGACNVNYEFKYDKTNENGYTNGCYGDDALFLDIDQKAEKVQFMLSGAIGWGRLDEVEIIPITHLKRLSSYFVKEGLLYHQITNNLSHDYYSGVINLAFAPDYLKEGETYLSYDGHYFYLFEDFKEMCDDLRNNHHEHAINQQPYYNYYQFVSHRTLSKITYEEILSYFEEYFMMKQSIQACRDNDLDSVHDILNQSQYVGYEKSFFENQNLFGSNAMMMLALSMNETASGKSSLAYVRNNLFGHAAFDSDVEKNASRYSNIANSISSHAKNYISRSYCNPEKFQYHGCFFGNKASGMNVSYASDPYWGEKAAQYYFKLDKAFGFKDYNSVALAIKTNYDKVDIKDENGEVLYSTRLSDMSFPVLEELSTAYKIQLDPSLYPIDGNEMDYTYSFQKNVGYIEKEAVQLIFNEDKIKEEKYQTVVFDAQQGKFNQGYSRLILEVKENEVPYVEEPTKEKALFVGWIQEKDFVYLAQYKAVQNIIMHDIPKTDYEIGERIDLSNGSIEVHFEDGTEEIVDLTTSMVSGYDLSEIGQQQVAISYAGCTTGYTIDVSDEMTLIKEELEMWIKKIDEAKEETDIQKWADYHTKLQQANPYLSFSAIRKLDLLYQGQSRGLSIVIKKNSVDLAVSGLYLACASMKMFEDVFIQDTAVIQYQGGIRQENDALIQQVAQANDYNWDSSFTLKGKMNFKALELKLPILVSINLPKTISNQEIVNVCLIKDGNVIKLPTVQSKERITFKTDELGEFVIFKRASVNQYEGENPIDTSCYLSNGTNYPLLILSVAAISLLIILVLILIVLRWKRIIKYNRKEKGEIN